MSTLANLSPEHLIRQAWEVFKLRPWLCIAISMVYSITQPGGSTGSGSSGLGDNLSEEMLTTIIVGGLVIIWLQCTFMGPFRGGYDLVMLRLARGDNSVTFGDLFAGFSKFVPLLLTFVLVGLCVAVGLILCFVPGIIILLGLWPAFLLVMEDDLLPVEAAEAAWRLTNGHKMDLIVLALANCAVLIVGLLCCCVGLLVAAPVTKLAWVGAYDEMRRASGAVASPPASAQPNQTSERPIGQPAPPALGPGDMNQEDGEEPTTDAPLDE